MKVFEKENKKWLTKIKFTLPDEKSEKRMGNIELIPLNNTCSIQDLSRKIIGFKKIDEMEMITSYAVTVSQNGAIKITGDLFNAFDMMSERGLIDLEIIRSLKDNIEFNYCIELTKSVEFGEEQAREKDQTKQTPQQFKPRLAALVDQLLSELRSLPKQDGGEWLLTIIARSGRSLDELQQLTIEAGCIADAASHGEPKAEVSSLR